METSASHAAETSNGTRLRAVTTATPGLLPSQRNGEGHCLRMETAHPRKARPMISKARFLTTIAAAALGISLFGACSAESLSERAISFGLEQAIEGDEDIDFDFGDDGAGGFTIQTDEGELSLNFDENGGGIEFDGVDGEGAITFDQNGIVFDTDEGQGTITLDQENGTINLESTEGDAQLSFDDNNITLETEEEEFGFSTSTEVPDGWPAVVGLPVTIDREQSQFAELNLGGDESITGPFSHDPSEPFAQNTIDRLASNGWTKSGVVSDGDMIQADYSDGQLIVKLVSVTPGMTTVVVQSQP